MFNTIFKNEKKKRIFRALIKPRGKHKLSGNGILNIDNCIKVGNSFYFILEFLIH